MTTGVALKSIFKESKSALNIEEEKGFCNLT